MQEWCYHYLLTGTLKDLTKGSVHDTELSPLIKTIKDAFDLAPYTEGILNCGYTGPINLDHKESIIVDILLHATTKRKAMLQQLHEGLEVYILIEVLQKKPKECLNLFVMTCESNVDAHYIISNLAPEMKDSGEEEDCGEEEYSGEWRGRRLWRGRGRRQWRGRRLTTFCSQCNAGSHTHLLVSDREKLKMVVIFDHSCLERMPNHTVCYPVVSAYAKTITFPTAHLRDYDAFNSNIETAIKYSARFDRV
ncbi:unnamed protein product [Oncorhynchus mykiss]|uniref:HECT domain-containing protein n=1 Tax=Oncorhynchus mykiss TaxID=8022 RepID=A0A060XN74_ONCMY|nr:unnamed protein product [Oncorhynchus mykiss]